MIIIKKALKLQNTQDAILLGKSLSQKDKIELSSLIKVLQINDIIKKKMLFKIQFIRESIDYKNYKRIL